MLFFVAVAVVIVVSPMILQYRIEKEMLANTTAQLEDDILSHEWLHTLARYHHPNGSSRERCDLVRKTIHSLIEQNTIVIGSASSGSTIRPWSETNADLLRRIDEETAETEGPTTDEWRFMFWIGLPTVATD